MSVVSVPCGALPRADYLDRIRALAQASSISNAPDPAFLAMDVGVFGSGKPDDTYALMWVLNALSVPLVLARAPYTEHGSWIAQPQEVSISPSTYQPVQYDTGVIPAAPADMITFGFLCFTNSYLTGTEGAVQFIAAPLLPNGFTIGWEKSYGNTLSTALSFERIPNLEDYYDNHVDGNGHHHAQAADGTVVAHTSIFLGKPAPPSKSSAFQASHDFTLQTVLIEQT